MRKRKHQTTFTERLEMARKSLSMTNRAIAEEHDLSPRRVGQILKSAECQEAIEAHRQAALDKSLKTLTEEQREDY